MNPPSMESIFLILSGVIVLAGVLYWFWSHLQLTQKKVQLLESAVFELRGMLSAQTNGPGSVAISSPSPSVPTLTVEEKIVYTDLTDDDEWETPVEEAVSPSSPDSENTVMISREDYNEDLQPGGRLIIPTDEEFQNSEMETVQEGEFKELFLQKEVPVVANSTSSESLESMPLKELRRLGEKRGIAGANEMRKKELLSALRNGVTGPQHTVTIEKALELNIDLGDNAEETVEAEILE